jgi:ribonuclease P protein component
VAAPARAHPGRVGYVIGKKALRHAVARNRVRRVLRVAVERVRPAIEAFDVILRVKRGCTREEVRLVAAEAAVLLAGLVAVAPAPAPAAPDSAA